jgi:hypothetical protein
LIEFLEITITANKQSITINNYPNFSFIMQLPTWSNFINNHPDREELCNLSAKIISMLNPDDPPNINTSKLIEMNSIVVVTLDPFSKQLSPMFFHHHLGLPIQNQPTCLVALTGFSNSAIVMEIDQEALFSATDTEIETPTLSQFMSFHDKDSNQLKTIETTPNNLSNIKLASVLPPPPPQSSTTTQYFTHFRPMGFTISSNYDSQLIQA